MTRAYISGPMRGLHNFGFDQFDSAAHWLRWFTAWDIVNPAEHDREVYPNIEQWPGFALGDSSLCPDFDLYAALRWDIRQITECDILLLLPGWERSAGVAVEFHVARECGLLLYEMKPTEEGWLGLVPLHGR